MIRDDPAFINMASSYLPEQRLIDQGNIYALKKKYEVRDLGYKGEIMRAKQIGKQIAKRALRHIPHHAKEIDETKTPLEYGAIRMERDDYRVILFDENGPLDHINQARRITIGFVGDNNVHSIEDDLRSCARYMRRENATEEELRGTYLVGYTHPRMARLATLVGMSRCSYSGDNSLTRRFIRETQAYHMAIRNVNGVPSCDFTPTAVYMNLFDFVERFSEPEVDEALTTA